MRLLAMLHLLRRKRNPKTVEPTVTPAGGALAACILLLALGHALARDGGCDEARLVREGSPAAVMRQCGGVAQQLPYLALLDKAIARSAADPASLTQDDLQATLHYLQHRVNMTLTFRAGEWAAARGWAEEEEQLWHIGWRRASNNVQNQLAFLYKLTELYMRQRRFAEALGAIGESWLAGHGLWHSEPQAVTLAVVYSQAAMRTALSLAGYAHTSALLDAMAQRFPAEYPLHHNRGLFHLSNYRWSQGKEGVLHHWC